MEVVIQDRRAQNALYLGEFAPRPSELRERTLELIAAADAMLAALPGDCDPALILQLERMSRVVTVGPRYEQGAFLAMRIQERVESAGARRCKLVLSSRNRALGGLVRRVLERHGTAVVIEYHHAQADFVIGAADTQWPFLDRFADLCSFVLRSALSVYFVAGAVIGWVTGNVVRTRARDGVLLWMGFANNREWLDYAWLDDLNTSELLALAPDPHPLSLLRRPRPWRRSSFEICGPRLLRLGPLVRVLTELWNGRGAAEKALDSLREAVEWFEPLQLGFGQVAAQTIDTAYCALQSAVVDAAATLPGEGRRAVLMFRGGNAAGVRRAQRVDAGQVTTVHMCHGTEVRPSNHFVHRYMDYVVLASEELVKSWYNEDAEAGKLLGLGRPYYEALADRVEPWYGRRDGVFRVGVALTYGSESEVLEGIDEIATVLSSAPFECRLVIKQRPNRSVDLTTIGEQQFRIEEWRGGIVGFLGCVDLVIAGMSDRGIVSMVTLDAIYLMVPALFDCRGVDERTVGYSWSTEFRDLTFFSASELKELLGRFDDGNALATYCVDAGLQARTMLGDSTGSWIRVKSFLRDLMRNESVEDRGDVSANAYS